MNAPSVIGCAACGRLNRLPAGTSNARCGACHTSLILQAEPSVPDEVVGASEPGVQLRWRYAFPVFGVATLLVALWLYFEARNVAHRLEEVTQQASSQVTKAARAQESSIVSSFRSELSQTSESVLKTSREKLTKELEDLHAELERERESLAAIQAQRQRAAEGLPELVDLDALNDYYAKRYEEVKSDYVPFETFQTRRGEISFSKNNYSFSYVPSSGAVSSIRIGKRASTENAELIKAWLSEATAVKEKLGYRTIRNRTAPSEYGQFTDKEYRKGDSFFRTYYQFERVQGTYGRYSLQYTFHIEVGSYSRVEQARVENYNKALGS